MEDETGNSATLRHHHLFDGVWGLQSGVRDYENMQGYAAKCNIDVIYCAVACFSVFSFTHRSCDHAWTLMSTTVCGVITTTLVR